MNLKILALASSLVSFTALIACGSSSTTSGTTTGSGGSSTTSTTATTGGTGGDPTPATSCIKPGDKGNSGGVGEYCSPGGQQCVEFTIGTACLADLGQDQWFCTKIGCKMDADCGENAVCHKDPQGAACVPSKCEGGGTGGAGGGGGSGGGGGAGGK